MLPDVPKSATTFVLSKIIFTADLIAMVCVLSDVTRMKSLTKLLRVFLRNRALQACGQWTDYYSLLWKQQLATIGTLQLSYTMYESAPFLLPQF